MSGLCTQVTSSMRRHRAPLALFTSDLHGSQRRYLALLGAIAREEPDLLLLGGDLLDSGLASLAGGASVLESLFLPELQRLRDAMGPRFPAMGWIPGNDDGDALDELLLPAEAEGLVTSLACRRAELAGWPVYGYPFIPPSPFMNKAWERYDVSRYTDPGCTPPEAWRPTGELTEAPQERFPTILDDLDRWTAEDDLSRAIFLFHAPPYQTALDRAALDGRQIDHCPLDVHIGSIAVWRFLETRQPQLSLHGHVHESARLAGAWRERLGRTWCFTGAHDGQELALVRIPLEDPAEASRELL